MKFKNPLNILEGEKSQVKLSPVKPAEDKTQMECDGCKKKLPAQNIIEKNYTCTNCGALFRMPARARLTMICDEGSFTEHDTGLQSKNILGFDGYEDKLLKSKKASGENEAVVTGTCEINKHKVAVFIMEPFFMMGSMGSVVGEKITRIFEYATRESLPVIGFSASGGARMQEGIFSLMQMAKTSGAVKKHGTAGNLFVSVLTNPTTGGVNASFAMLGDIIVAEPNALIGFAGPRVIEQTIRKKLPAGFQRAEFVLEKGFIDTICERKDLRDFISTLLDMHEASKQKAAIVLLKAREANASGSI